MSMDIEQYYDRIYRYCYFKVNNKSLAEDLTQETFLRFLNSESREPERYLYTIARNLCIDEYRRRRFAGEPQDEEPSEESFENSLIERIDLKKALDALPEDEREILILRYSGDEQISEISRLLGISRFAVHRKLRSAEKELKKQLGGKEVQ